MKLYFLALSVRSLVVACNISPENNEITTIPQSDSIFVLQPELPGVKAEDT